MPFHGTEARITPLNVMGLIQGKVFPRSAPSIGFPIKAPTEVKEKAIPNRILTMVYQYVKDQTCVGLTLPNFTWISR